jgi:hypothetical protein
MFDAVRNERASIATHGAEELITIDLPEEANSAEGRDMGASTTSYIKESINRVWEDAKCFGSSVGSSITRFFSESSPKPPTQETPPYVGALYVLTGKNVENEEDCRIDAELIRGAMISQQEPGTALGALLWHEKDTVTLAWEASKESEKACLEYIKNQKTE